ncbi:CRISPR-associated endonuclease [Actinidia chinensis var. chinensis]|uniref:CRISPR-associated endonuclease n=1 Tax=Actinidia chinensis var. chinensis TaxID=1590841 RepID=A0A2R6R500_ACTCC|nr:CRISPR-associated endonuclease [Actinidia chinensis var. chinensis]
MTVFTTTVMMNLRGTSSLVSGDWSWTSLTGPSMLSAGNVLYVWSSWKRYCSSPENLTIHHVLPIARGGKWTWENLVTACSKCNSRKGQKTLEEAKLKLLKVPKAPKDYDILAIPLTNKAIMMLRMRKGTPEEWHQYLSKPSSEP